MEPPVASSKTWDSTSHSIATSWDVFWCYEGWQEIADRLEAALPSWAKLRRLDPSQPLKDQVAHADVLIPTSGLVDEHVIRAAAQCKLIAQPAAGINSIAVGVAKELGIPVTNAPGKTGRNLVYMHIEYY